MSDPLGFITRCAREYGDVVRMRLGNTRVFFVNHPELIEEVLRTHAADVIKDTTTRMISPIVGNGLLTSEGSFWRRQRKLAQPTFQHQQIERYGEVMVELASRLRETWDASAGKPRDLHEDLGGLTLAIVGKTLFGADVGDESRDVGAALTVMTDYYLNPWKWFRVREWFPTRANREFRRAVRRVDEIINGLIRSRRARGGETSDDSGDLLGRLLAAQDDEGAGMTDAQLRDECVTLFLAGHETTGLALTYTFYLLARHPEVDARLATELDEVLGGRPPTANDVPRLHYTEAVVRESMRLYPPAWAIGREAIQPFTLGGYHVSTGTQLLIAQWIVHRDPRWWAEPETFSPERWENDLARRLPRGVYIPFGDGPRVCIGNHFAMMETILVLATLAQRHRVEPVSGESLSLSPSITLRPRSGTRMIVRRRNPIASSVAATD
jgi:cytochrome P450